MAWKPTQSGFSRGIRYAYNLLPNEQLIAAAEGLMARVPQVAATDEPGHMDYNFSDALETMADVLRNRFDHDRRALNAHPEVVDLFIDGANVYRKINPGVNKS